MSNASKVNGQRVKGQRIQKVKGQSSYVKVSPQFSHAGCANEANFPLLYHYPPFSQIKGRCLRVMSLHRGEAIIEASDANKIDVIVMGTREAGVAGRGVAQSTTVYVSHNSRMPALLVRGHEMEEAPGKK